MKFLFNTILYQPLYNAIIILYNIIGDLGVVIIICTLVIKFVLWPLSKRGIDMQKRMQELKPKLDEINKKYKGDAQGKSMATMALYKDHNFNPATSCLPILIQLPIIWAVYRAFTIGIKGGDLELLYGFVKAPIELSSMFAGIFDLSVQSVKINGINPAAWAWTITPACIFPVLAAAGQYWQTRMMMAKKKKDEPKQEKSANPLEAMNQQMVFTMPFIMLVIGFSLPAGLSLYWFVGTLVSILQQHLVLRDTGAKSQEVVSSESVPEESKSAVSKEISAPKEHLLKEPVKKND